MCSKSLNKLAQPLPMAHCANSRLVCKISGEVMNENNPPMMLPNGYVYGYNVSLYIPHIFYLQWQWNNINCFHLLLMLIICPSFSSLFYPFAKMTRWSAPEPKKSSTSLRLRRCTSCDGVDTGSHVMHTPLQWIPQQSLQPPCDSAKRIPQPPPPTCQTYLPLWRTGPKSPWADLWNWTN